MKYTNITNLNRINRSVLSAIIRCIRVLIQTPWVLMGFVILMTLSISLYILLPRGGEQKNTDITLTSEKLKIYGDLLRTFGAETVNGPEFVVEEEDYFGRPLSYTVEKVKSNKQQAIRNTPQSFARSLVKTTYAKEPLIGPVSVKDSLIKSSHVSIPSGYTDTVTYTKDGYSLSLTPLRIENTEAGAHDNTLIYSNAATNTDVVLQAMNQGVKEHIILKNAQAPKSFAWNIDYGSLEVYTHKSGAIGFFKPGTGEKMQEIENSNPKKITTDLWPEWRVFEIPAPYAVDAIGRKSDNVTMELKNGILTITIDPQFLKTAAYPVLLDPTIVDDTTSEITAGATNRLYNSGSPVLETFYQEMAVDINTVGLWHMNEIVINQCSGGTNDICDATANANNGAFNGGATFTSSSRLGSSAATFDGTDDFISLGTPAIFDFGSGDFTYEAWIKTTYSGANHQKIVGDDANANANRGLTVLASTQKAHFQCRDASANAITASGSISVNDGNWHHIAGVRSGASGYLYVDGVLDTYAVNTSTGSCDAGVATYIGSRNTSPQDMYFNGQIDEVRISNVARTAEEIRLNALRRPYASVTSKAYDFTTTLTTLDSLAWSENGVRTGDGETLSSSTSLIAQWNLNAGSGTSAVQSAGSCGSTCDLTISNATTSGEDAAAMDGWTENNKRWGASAFMFDGVDAYAECTDANCGGTSKLDYPGSGGWTVSTWYKPTATGDRYIILKTDAYNINTGSTAVGCTTDRFGFSTYNGSVWTCVAGTSPILLGEWYFLVATFDGTNGKLYVNGILEKTTAINVPQNSAFNFGIGGGSLVTDATGVIDSSAVYARALGQNEIIALYNHSNIDFQTRTGDTANPDDGTWEAWMPVSQEAELGSTGDMDGPYQYSASESNLQAYWAMDETSGDSVEDVSANSNTGIASGGGTTTGFEVDTGGTLLTNLVAYWKLDETSGTRDDVIGTNDLTSTGVTSATGKKSNAGDFEVSEGDFLGGTDNATVSTGDVDYSIAAWVKLESLPGATQAAIVGKYVGGGKEYILYVNTADKLSFLVGNDNVVSWGSAASVDTWYFVVGWHDAASNTINIQVNNGTAVSASCTACGVDQTTSFAIGSFNGGSASTAWDGLIDEVGLWKKVLSSTERTDLYNSGNGNTHTTTSPSGAPTVDGKFGKARGFNGTSQYISVADNATLDFAAADDFTVEAWVKHPTISAADVILTKATTPYLGYTLYMDASGDLCFDVGDATNSDSNCTSAIDFDDTAWHHVAGVKDGTTSIKLYVDGVERVSDSSIATTGTLANTASLYIGIERDAATQGWEGDIDEVRIYNTNLSAATIREKFLEGANQISGNQILNSTDTSLKVEGTGSQKTVLGAPKVDAKTAGLWRLDETANGGVFYDATGYRSFATDTTGNLESELASYWKLDEDTHTTAADAVSKNNRTASGTAAVVAGKLGDARDFDGSTGFLGGTTETNLDFNDTSDMTICGWFNRDTFTTDDIIASKKNTLGTAAGYAVYIDDADDKLYLNLADGTDQYNISSTTTFTATGWNHFCAIWDQDSAANTEIWINGVDDNATDSGTIGNIGSLDSGLGFAIGVTADSTGFFDGKIDELGVWRRALSSTEISDLYGAGAANVLTSKASNNGAIVSGATAGNEGYYNKAVKFATDGDRVETAQVSYGYSDFSVEAWVYPTGSGSTWNFIVSQCDNSTHLWNFSYSTARVLHFNSGVGGTPSMNGVGAIPLNKWSHVAATRVGSTGVTTLYINGVQDDQETLTAGTMSTASRSVVMGWYCAGTNQNMIGSLDEVKISNTTRSYDEIRESYYAGRGHRMGKAITSTDLSGKSTIPFYIAADRPGTYLEATVGESSFANYEPDTETDGLWHFEEINGTSPHIKDASGKGNTVAVPVTVPSVLGKIGRGRSFDGSTSYLTAADSADWDFGTSDFTVDWWEYRTSNANGKTALVRDSTDTFPAFLLGYSSNGANLLVYLSSTGSSWDIASGQSMGPVTLNQWVHLAITRSGTTFSTYKNGVLQATFTSSGSLAASSGDLRFGRYTASAVNYYFSGTLDEVRVTKGTAYTTDQIRQVVEISKRTHPITIDFVSNPQATYSSGTSVTINNMSGQHTLPESLQAGDTIIFQENVGGTEYRGTATVRSVAHTSRTYGTVTLEAAASSFPPAGYTTNAKVFKWQREYFPLHGITLRGTHDNAITRLTIRATDGSQGANIWIDDFKTNTDYLTTPGGSTITSTAADQRYYQYRGIFTSADPGVSANLTSVTTTYNLLPAPSDCKIDDSGQNGTAIVKWTDNSSTEDLFRVQRSDDGGAFANLGTTAADATSYTDSTTATGHTYAYQVRAEDGSENSSYCGTATVSYQTGNFYFEGVGLEGLQIN